MSETVRDYYEEAGVAFTRCRPYRKNDQAWVEQKNGAVVRRIVGYRRFEGLEAAAVLARLYRSVRLFVNYFQPSFKLAEKTRDGAKVLKRYHAPATPHQRLLSDPRSVVALIGRMHALSPASIGVQATRTEFGRPNSSMRLRTWTATATSFARRSSVCERSPSPITCLKRAIIVSARARLPLQLHSSFHV